MPLIALGLAAAGHQLGIPGFGDAIMIPAIALAAVGALGALGRLSPKIRRHMTRIVPQGLPAPAALVWLTGALELLGAIGLLIEPLRPWAALGFLLLFLAVFPANVVDARMRGSDAADVRARILKRGAVQVVFIALSVWVLLGSML